MTKKRHSEPQKTTTTRKQSQEDPVGGLKLTLEKLSDEVKNLGLVLGISTETQKPDQSNAKSKEESTSGKNDFARPEMSQEDKQEQRKAKAAEKKARAEAAAAKKAQNAPQVAAPKNKKENPEAAKSDNQKDETPPKEVIKTEKAENPPTENMEEEPKEKAVRSVLKHGGSGQNNGKGVHFDLNVLTKTESEESLATTLPEPPVLPMEDASSIAHIHPAFLTISARCERELVDDLEQLCKEFIGAFREYLQEWAAARLREGSDPKTVGHDLDLAIRPQLAHLTQFGRWPLPYALGNIVRQLKKEILKMDGSRTSFFNGEKDPTMAQIQVLDEWLEDTSRTNFNLAYDAIALHLNPKIKNVHSVMTYDWCPVVNHVLLASLNSYPKLGVCIVDSELNGRGIRHVNSLIENGYRCQYTDLKSVGYAISKSSMVVLGCSAVLSNGCVAATKGALQIALAAKAFNVPLLVASQTFKFVDKVQSYARTALLSRDAVELIPSMLVTAIVTDIRILPPSAAPAVLKAKALDLE
ncbi:unnamed protein product [Caenorhabditis auriculariae]|uniref:Translation initiation factor eIF2B subunit delta n=1 Tax=Caenorhabditis auriculariae TaxID=2777116 RepID=A0A8S1HRP9_9PELO|nr:unnamed protein product [Caenorhabditis auriculariae]